ncbi:SpoIIE family protein phosphatase [Treponema sp. R8-4-B8]
MINSIRTKILVIVLIFIILTGASFIIYSITTTENYKRLRLESIQKTLDIETEKVNKMIAELERSAVFYALGGQLCYEEQSEKFGEEFVLDGVGVLVNAVGGGFWFEPYSFNSGRLRAGFYAFLDKTTNKAKIDNIFFMDEYDYHNRNWYREISQGVTRPFQVVWTKPYVDDTGTFSLMTTAGAGIFKNGKLIAITTVDWEIEEVIKKLIMINPTKNSFVLLCVPDKDYIISSVFTDSFTGESLKSIPWDISSDRFTYKNINYLRFGRYMKNGWLLSIQIPEKEIFEDVEKRNSLFTGIIEISFVAILVLAYLFVSMFINTPIKNLTSGVERIELGNLDKKIDVKSNDELGQLARTFNKMTGDLKKAIDENVHEREEKNRINTELAIAREIQASMLPAKFPAFPLRDEFDIFAEMIPAKEVGGDFYDFFLIDKDNLAVVIADVSGKGIPASLFMVNTKTLINYFSSDKNPKDVFEFINKKLCQNNDACIFVTSIMGIYNIPTGRFVFVNAGHNPPLLKKNGSSFEYIRSKPQIVLAVMRDAKYAQEEITLNGGDTLYFYTDGVTEAMNGSKELFGEERLLDALNKYKLSSPKELIVNIKKEVDYFAAGAQQADDIAMLALHINENKNADTKNEITVEAKKESLNEVIKFLSSKLIKTNYPLNIQNEIEIAVEEVFTNIVNYAYGQEGGRVKISISTENGITLKFEDNGQPFNPKEHEAPDLNKPINEREIGGLGLYMIKKIMDRVEYAREDGKNILIISKKPPLTA